jgi:hypothetical protein
MMIPETGSNLDSWRVFVRAEFDAVALFDFHILTPFRGWSDFCPPNFPGHGFGRSSFSHDEMKNATIVPA